MLINKLLVNIKLNQSMRRVGSRGSARLASRSASAAVRTSRRKGEGCRLGGVDHAGLGRRERNRRTTGRGDVSQTVMMCVVSSGWMCVGCAPCVCVRPGVARNHEYMKKQAFAHIDIHSSFDAQTYIRVSTADPADRTGTTSTQHSRHSQVTSHMRTIDTSHSTHTAVF